MTNKKKKQKTETPSEAEAGGAADPMLAGQDVSTQAAPVQAAVVETPYAEMTRDAAQAAVQAMADQLAPGSPGSSGQLAPGEGAHGPGRPAAGSTEGAAGQGATAEMGSSVGPAPSASWQEAIQQAVQGMSDGAMFSNPQAAPAATAAPATAPPANAPTPPTEASSAEASGAEAPAGAAPEQPAQPYPEMTPEAAVAALGNLVS